MFVLPQGRPAVMGILNVTPDSFSDGGAYPSVEAALDATRQMMADGADLIDVGGESTRPGAEPVAEDVELARIEPVLTGLAREGIPFSIDTMKAAVARAALELGAAVVNDVSALRDLEMIAVLGHSNASVCLMHMKGSPPTMQDHPTYEDVVAEVRDFLLAKAHVAEAAGIARERIWLDPGIGFGKTDAHNLALLRNLHELVQLGYPVMIGVSRKGFLGRMLGGAPVKERLPAALALQTLAQEAGARIIRTHDVREARQATEITAAVLVSSDMLSIP